MHTATGITTGIFGGNLAQMSARIAALSNIAAYLKLGETSGTNAADSSGTGVNGTYTGTYTLAQPGIGDGSLSTLFAGGRVSLAAVTAALDTAMGDKSKGTIHVATQVTNAGVWSDATIRGMLHIGADANNRVFMNKNNTTNEILFSHRAGGTVKSINYTFSSTAFFTATLTWDKVADQVKAFVNGAQVGSTLTGLGVFAGALFSTFTAIGDSSSSGSQPYAGYLQHILIRSVASTPAEVALIGAL